MGQVALCLDCDSQADCDGDLVCVYSGSSDSTKCVANIPDNDRFVCTSDEDCTSDTKCLVELSNDDTWYCGSEEVPFPTIKTCQEI